MRRYKCPEVKGNLADGEGRKDGGDNHNEPGGWPG